MMRGIAGVLLLAALAGAQTAADVTERAGALKPVLEALLYPDGAPDRSVLLVVDPTPSVNAARLHEALGELLNANRSGPRLGVAVIGRDPVPPGAEPAKILDAIKDGLKGAKLEVRNVYDAVRGHLSLLKGGPERRELVLITLENGDLEDDLEKTVHLASRAGVRVHVIAREAFLSDTYWQWRTPPRAEGTYHGPDGAFVDVPWGWVFQVHRVTEAAPSGHAMYGLSRLASGTGGRVFVYYPKRGKHECQLTGSCTICAGDHMAPLEVLRAQRVRAIAPPIASRRDIYADGARDACFRAVLEAWEDAAKEGLVRTFPPVKRRGKRLVESNPRQARIPSWTGTSWRGFARDAGKLAKAADRIARDLKEDLDGAEGSDRNRSIAELTYLMLRITRVNLLLCEAYCNEIESRIGEEVEPPERKLVPDDYRVTGLGYRNLSLCHGIAPYAHIKLPGGDEVRKEVMALGPVLKEFHKRNAYSPFAIAAARMGLASFHPVGIGKRTTPPPREIRGSNDDTTTTRPPRGGGTSGGSSGPTSGGG